MDKILIFDDERHLPTRILPQDVGIAVGVMKAEAATDRD
jgi:hypothetical protein